MFDFQPPTTEAEKAAHDEGAAIIENAGCTVGMSWVSNCGGWVTLVSTESHGNRSINGPKMTVRIDVA